MLDVARRCWSQPMLDAAEIDRRLLPAVFESPAICARVSSDAAALTGLPAGTPIVAGAGDQAAGAVGMGITRPGRRQRDDRHVRSGLRGDRPSRHRSEGADPHLLPRDAWTLARDGRDAGGRPVAALVPRSARPPVSSYDELTAEAARVPPGAGGVLWAPYLMGERTPHCDPNARAALVGLAASHTRGHVVRAILEGVAFSLRDTFVDLLRARRPGRARPARRRRMRGRRSGARSRPMSTAIRLTRPAPKKGRRTAPRFWPRSASDAGQRWTRRAMLWSAVPLSRCLSRRW